MNTSLIRVAFLAGAFLLASGCAKPPPAADLSMLPYLGEERSHLENRLAPFKIDYNEPDAPITFYRFRVDDDLIRLSFNYALRKDGKDVLSIINIRHDNIEHGVADTSEEATALSDDSRKALINAMLPDRKQLPISSLSAAVQQDAAPPDKHDEDSAFFSSVVATYHVVQNPYWDIPKQQWVSNASCPASSPTTVQVHSDNTDGTIDEAGIYSEWLFQCMRREAFK
jgi:hypothetical protein